MSTVCDLIRRAAGRPSLAVLLAVAVSMAVPVTAPLRAQELHVLDSGWSFAKASADGARPADAAFAAVAVPAAWETHQGTDFDGIGWYRCALPALTTRDASLRVSVRFGAVATDARVFVNDIEVGGHLGAWTPFTVDLTALARDGRARCDGTDRLEVRVDEKVGHNTQGFHPIIQPHFGGIWKDVRLRADLGATIDPDGLLVFGTADGEVRIDVPVRATAVDTDLRVHVHLRDGARELAKAQLQVLEGRANGTLAVPAPRPWSPRAPHLYRAEIELRDATGAVLDHQAHSLGFRDLAARGRKLRLNGAPLQIRGALHWGYEPPLLAPNPEPSVWRRELEDLRARGFNLVKCCLWIPPRAFYDIADEVGLLVWQEYPTWHPKMTPEHRAALTQEFEEFYRYDRSHVSVAFRSLTCETGHSADIGVIRDLYERAHAAIPQALVVDDSSWISWHRVHDFYDDHPYGNNNEWRAKLRHFDEFIKAREAKPLLLGECIAADTWFDRDAWLAEHGEAAPQPWWAPRCLDDQARFESWFRDEFGAPALARLRPESIAYAMRNRKYQIERLRLDLPDAGYVVSVLRDFTLARMGLYDHLGRAKFTPEEWRWHGDTMLCLDTEDDRRGFVDRTLDLGLRVSHYGPRPVRGRLHLRLEDAETSREHAVDVDVEPGTVSARIAWRPELDYGAQPRRVRLHARLQTDDGTFINQWDLWHLPHPLSALPPGVRIVERLDAATVAFLEGGGRVVLRAAERKGSLRCHSLWFLRGAPFAPEHPINERFSRAALLGLQSFDLEQSWVAQWDLLRGEVDPILAFWETHDIAEVRSYLFAADTNVGAGRLLITTLNHDSAAGQAALGSFLQHLARGPAPRRALSEKTLAALRQAVAAEQIGLEEWELRPDPEDRGLAEDWSTDTGSDPAWKAVRAGQHWEQQGFPQMNGVGWYRRSVEIPAHWDKATVHAVFDGVDDSYRFYVNGEEIGRHGDPATGETVWLKRTSLDLTGRLRPGANHLALRVVDHTGAGGVWKPVYLTTGPVDDRGDLLH